MPNSMNSAGSGALSTITRRRVLMGGAAAALSATMVGCTQLRSEPLRSAEDRLQDCLEELRTILVQLHPAASEFKTSYTAFPDGGYFLHHIGFPPKVPWTGPGYYEIRDQRKDPYTVVLWVDEVWSHMDRCRGYRAYARDGGRQVGVSSYFTEDNLCIVRKLREVLT